MQELKIKREQYRGQSNLGLVSSSDLANSLYYGTCMLAKYGGVDEKSKLVKKAEKAHSLSSTRTGFRKTYTIIKATSLLQQAIFEHKEKH